MKTAISIPDETFERVQQRAATLGMSRSEFFVCAVRHYLDQLDAESLTDRINAALDLAWPDDSWDAAVLASHRHLAASEDDW